MSKTPVIHTIDLNFQNVPNTIGVFLIPHAKGGVLIECGPSSTLPILINGLAQFNLSPQEITDVFITHIHLDHAGSAGWWAKQGANIHVHNLGGPHLQNPEKLIASAERIYRDKINQLWGEFLPVPEHRLNYLYDNDEINIGGLAFRAVDTPGHANHHMSYILDTICFSGDIGGVRIQGVDMVRLPTVPPEFHLEEWRSSIQKLRQENITSFATTHFGIHSEPRWHMDTIEQVLNETEDWMEFIMPKSFSQSVVREHYSEWISTKCNESGLPTVIIAAFDAAISSHMSADGIFRYWHKYRLP